MFFVFQNCCCSSFEFNWNKKNISCKLHRDHYFISQPLQNSPGSRHWRKYEEIPRPDILFLLITINTTRDWASD